MALILNSWIKQNHLGNTAMPGLIMHAYLLLAYRQLCGVQVLYLDLGEGGAWGNSDAGLCEGVWAAAGCTGGKGCIALHAHTGGSGRKPWCLLHMGAGHTGDSGAASQRAPHNGPRNVG